MSSQIGQLQGGGGGSLIVLAGMQGTSHDQLERRQRVAVPTASDRQTDSQQRGVQTSTWTLQAVWQQLVAHW